MKIIRVIKIILLYIMINYSISFAAIESSPHDIISFENFKEEEMLPGGKTNCSYCHPAFEDAGIKIWKRVPVSLEEFGQISPRCYSCHDGVSIVNINVDASRTAFAPESHGFFQNRIKGGVSELNVSLDFLEGKPLDCTTCHDIHNNEFRPFLVAPIEELCTKCHFGRRNSGFGSENAESNHPIAVPLLDSAGDPSPIVPQPIFMTPFPEPYPLKDGKISEGTHWDLGGHLTVGNIGNIECFTCHSVHGDESKGPNAHLMAVDPVNKVNNAFCEGCHRGERGDGNEDISNAFPNPGGTKDPRTYHPVDDDESNGKGRIVKIAEPEGWPFGTGDEKTLLCSTCHDVHYAMPFSPILRTPAGDTFCEECHDENMEGHHLSGEDSNEEEFTFATTGYSWTYDHEVDWDNGNPVIKFEQEVNIANSLDEVPKKNGYGKTYGNKVENKVYCSSCHRAHNAGAGIEDKATPLLIVSHTANQLCFMCHAPANVAFNSDPNWRASHFLGDPLSNDTYGYPEEKLHLNYEKWPETELKSKYGGDNEREVICQSCHTFNQNNLNNPKYSYVMNTLMLIAKADRDTEWIVGTGIVYKKEDEEVTGEVISEDEEDSYDDSEEDSSSDTTETITGNAFLCIGCHSEDPGGGASHPMMKLDGVMPDGSKMDRTEHDPPVTYTKNLNMNCFSCHFIHKGKNEGGVYILKEVASEENSDPKAIHPKIFYDSLCIKCHLGYLK